MMLKEFKKIKNLSLNFGPQHTAAHGVLHLVLDLDGKIEKYSIYYINLLYYRERNEICKYLYLKEQVKNNKKMNFIIHFIILFLMYLVNRHQKTGARLTTLMQHNLNNRQINNKGYSNWHPNNKTTHTIGIVPKNQNQRLYQKNLNLSKITQNHPAAVVMGHTKAYYIKMLQKKFPEVNKNYFVWLKTKSVMIVGHLTHGVVGEAKPAAAYLSDLNNHLNQPITDKPLLPFKDYKPDNNKLFNRSSQSLSKNIFGVAPKISAPNYKTALPNEQHLIEDRVVLYNELSDFYPIEFEDIDYIFFTNAAEIIYKNLQFFDRTEDKIYKLLTNKKTPLTVRNDILKSFDLQNENISKNQILWESQKELNCLILKQTKEIIPLNTDLTLKNIIIYKEKAGFLIIYKKLYNIIAVNPLENTMTCHVNQIIMVKSSSTLINYLPGNYIVSKFF